MNPATSTAKKRAEQICLRRAASKYVDRLDLPTRALRLVISAFVEIITGGREKPTIAMCRAQASMMKSAVAGGRIACTAQSSLAGRHLLLTKYVRYCLPAQPIDATQALNLSAGVSNCKVSRGRSLS